MAMKNKDPLLVVLGIALIVLTFLLCGESPKSVSSVTTTQPTVTIPPPIAKVVEPSAPPPGIVKKKIDDLLIGRTITFQTNSAVILPEGLATLDQALPILQENRTAAFEISGHTDNVGAEDNNRALSENRAKAVMDYLVAKGVAANRLTSKGYGSSRSIADNATAEGRSRNRRIEFLVRVKGDQP
jgi:OmpA-OmpF porin, OOP family